MLSELANYAQRIEDLHSQIRKLIEGLSIEALNWQPFNGDVQDLGNSLAALTAHIAGAEQFWIGEVVGKQPSRRNREAEFQTTVKSINELPQILDQVFPNSKKIISSLTDESLAEIRTVDGRAVSVRWAILHVIDHTALHLGHMQITFQLWNQGKSHPSPFWHQRLPNEL